jgi:hypothetical protein
VAPATQTSRTIDSRMGFGRGGERVAEIRRLRDSGFVTVAISKVECRAGHGSFD